MPQPARDPSRLRVSQLNRRATLPVDLRLDAEARAAMAAQMDLLDLPKASLAGVLEPEGGEGWRFTGQLHADVVQPCVVTLKPVRTHLEEPVVRIWSPHVTEPDAAGETEMRDDEIEALGQTIDLGAVLAEALSLALPPYPRCEDAALPDAVDEAPAEDRRRPFADLDKLLKRDDG